MIYRLLHFYVGQVLYLFIRKIDIKGLENAPANGPVLIAANHPNSFLDGIIVATQFKRPVWSLGRGDAFKKSWVGSLLAQFKMLPIYRLSEGAENLYKNDDTFDRVMDLFQKNEQVLIFIEGLCTNQTKLLPLKKGTARMLNRAWSEAQLPLQVLPLGITYSNFTSFGKYVNIEIGERLTQTDFDNIGEGGTFLKNTNNKLAGLLNHLMNWNFKPTGFLENPAFYIGWLVNFPVYILAALIGKITTKGTVHRDSVTFAIVVFTLPIYWAIIWSWIL